MTLLLAFAAVYRVHYNSHDCIDTVGRRVPGTRVDTSRATAARAADERRGLARSFIWPQTLWRPPNCPDRRGFKCTSPIEKPQLARGVDTRQGGGRLRFARACWGRVHDVRESRAGTAPPAFAVLWAWIQVGSRPPASQASYHDDDDTTRAATGKRRAAQRAGVARASHDRGVGEPAHHDTRCPSRPRIHCRVGDEVGR